MGIFDEVAAKNSSGLSLFGENTALAKIGNTLVNESIGYAQSKMKSSSLPYLNAAISGVAGYQQGGAIGAAEAVLNSGILQKVFSASMGTNRWLAQSQLHANLTLAEVQRIVMLAYATEHARKNLWLINISDYSANVVSGSLTNLLSSAVGRSVSNTVGGSWGGLAGTAAKQLVNGAINSLPIANALSENGGGIVHQFNMLATNLNYTPFSLESNPFNVGAALVDSVKSAGKAELSITTMDDEHGTIKRWFKHKASQIVHTDGTVGLPSESLIKVRILHGFVNDASNKGGFEEAIICRPVSVDYEFDRRADELQEFTMRFEQTDTFIR